MYRLLVVEDEYASRRWLLKKLDWEQLGFHEVVSAENGVQALAMLSEMGGVDAVITDIRMPLMDGLQLAGEIRSLYPQAEIVILSGFGDFEYAQQAIRFEVRDYLTKPISKERLEQVAERVKIRLDDKYLQTTKMQQAVWLQKEKTELEKTNVLFRWLRDKEKVSAFHLKMQQFGIQFHHPEYWILVVELDEYHKFRFRYNQEDRDLCTFIISNIFGEVMNPYGSIGSTHSDRGQFVFIMPYDQSQGDWEQYALRIGEQLIESLHKHLKLFKVSVSVGCSRATSQPERLPSCYEQATRALERKFISGYGQVHLYSEEAAESRASLSDVPYEMEHQMLQAFKEHRFEQGIACLSQYLNALAKLGEVALIKQIACECLANLTKSLRDFRSVSTPELSFIEFLERLSMTDEFSQFKDDALKYVQSIYDRFHEQRRVSRMDRAVEYMKLHMTGDLSLQEVADYVDVGYHRFSKLFKQEKGQNFIDFLVSLRMQRALELLESSDRTIASIGEEVGYYNYRYFIKVFKDQYGITPTQYRERLMTVI
ncbi:response regulator [Paenibacillus sp. J5C_2022]|uniref:response regulator n=1 Tax=Paenibacillus sp. J5C2022 TaxID=2977129 RepID=UPI0021D18BFD|nr:response regulator [Paenibacillus sp. J5C2022]MCU6708572.1 response regulator [Paenibacillus sp. J5C2022]